MTSPQIVLWPVEFDDLFDHLTNRDPKYKNMHLRATRTKTVKEGEKKKQKRSLRYLHIIYKKSENVIEGAISGKGINAVYEMTRGKRTVPVVFREFDLNEKEMKRLQKQFKKELFKTVRDEQKVREHDFSPRRLKGQFYVKRWQTGSSINDANCQQALASGDLSRSFLERLEPWQFQLMCP